MSVQVSIEPCATCGEPTPHARHSVPWPRLVALALALAGAACFVAGARWTILGIALALLGAWLFLRDRESLWNIACERCRGKKRAERRNTKPRLDGNTEIHLL